MSHSWAFQLEAGATFRSRFEIMTVLAVWNNPKTNTRSVCQRTSCPSACIRSGIGIVTR